ncbi:MAG TPA: TolC family protein [Paludibacter sp.]
MNRKRIVKQSMLALLVLLGAQLQAQKMYTLDECIQQTLTNNLQVKNSQLDEKSINAQITEAKSGFLPSVDLNGQYQYYITIPSMLVPAEMFGGPKGDYKAISFSSKQTTTANIQVSEVLFNQKIFIALKAAKTAKNMTALQLTKTKEDLIYNVSAVYYNIQVLNENLAMLDSNIISMEKMLAINKSLEANNILSKSKYKRLEINFENLKNERQNLGLSGEKAANLLKFLMGLPMTDAIAVNNFQEKEYQLSAAVVNVDKRTDIQLMNKQIEIANLNKQIAISDFYPTLAGVYNYGLTGYNNEFSLTKTINDSWLKSSYIGLQLKVPIFSGFSRTQKVKQKEFDVQKAKNNLELVKQSAQKEVSDAQNNYLSRSNSFDNTKRSLSLAKEVFQSSNTEYENGIISITDLLLIQNDLTTARNNYSNAMINLRLAEIELQKSKGELANNK